MSRNEKSRETHREDDDAHEMSHDGYTSAVSSNVAPQATGTPAPAPTAAPVAPAPTAATAAPTATPAPTGTVTKAYEGQYEKDHREDDDANEMSHDGHDGYTSAVSSNAAPQATGGTLAPASTAAPAPTAALAPIAAPTGTVTKTYESQYENYRFDVANGQVTAAYEVKGGRTYLERLDANETYTVSGSNIIKTEAGRYGQEVTTYADTNGNGLYAKVTEQWIPATTTTVQTAPQIATALSYIPTSGDDTIAVRAGQQAVGGQGRDQFVLREASHVEIGDFHAGEGDHLVFDTGLGMTSFQDLLSRVTGASYDGHDFYVELRDGTAVTLVGVNPADMTAANVEVLS